MMLYDLSNKGYKVQAICFNLSPSLLYVRASNSCHPSTNTSSSAEKSKRQAWSFVYIMTLANEVLELLAAYDSV
jgi:hypothetical protein